MIIKVRQNAVRVNGQGHEYREKMMEYEIDIPIHEERLQAKADDFIGQLNYLMDRLQQAISWLPHR